MSDLIKRSDAIKVLKDSVVEMGGDDFCEMGVHIDDIEAVVNAIPSADRPTWNPCSERLPEATGFYICTVNRELFDVRTMKFEMLAEGGYRWLLRNGLEVFPSFVLAWMPLPKPWKGADDEID